MASLRKYTCTCEVTLTPGFFLVNLCKICIKIHQKFTKNLVLEPFWGALGAILGPPGNQDAPKRRPRAPKRRQDRNFWSNLTQLGSNLEAETLSNRGQKPKKSMLKNIMFMASIFKGFEPRFGRVFGRFLGPKMHEKSKNAKLAKTLKIVILPR